MGINLLDRPESKYHPPYSGRTFVRFNTLRPSLATDIDWADAQSLQDNLGLFWEDALACRPLKLSIDHECQKIKNV